MERGVDKVSQDSFYGNILLGLPETLEKAGIHDILIERQSGLTEPEINQWETKNGVRLPDNIRQFYTSTDGLSFSWVLSKPFSDMDLDSIEGAEEHIYEEEEAPSGRILINPLSDLTPILDFATSNVPGVKVKGKEFELILGAESKVFALEPLLSGATVALVYTHKEFKPTIWLYTEEKKFHFLAKHFVRYLRMAIAYWGIPDWQFVFTKQNPPGASLELLQVFVPHILLMTNKYDIVSSTLSMMRSDDDFAALLMDEVDCDLITDEDFHNVPLNKIDSEFFLKAKNQPMPSTPENSMPDLIISVPKKVEKKTPTAKSRVTPTKPRRKPLYYIKHQPQ